MVKVFRLKNSILTRFLFFTIFYCCHSVSFGQNNRIIDSLKTILNTPKSQLHDTTRINTLNTLARKLMDTNPDTSVVLSLEALKLSRILVESEKGTASLGKVPKKGMAQSYHNLAIFNRLQGNYSVALEYNLKALTIRESLKDTLAISISLGNIGVIYTQQRDYKKALDYYLRALKISQALNDKNGIARHLGNIGNIYLYQMEYAKALSFYFEALKIAEEIGDTNGIAQHLGNIGMTYSEQAEIAKSLQRNTAEANSLHRKALDYNLKYLELAKKIENKNFQAIALHNIGSVYIILNRNKEAEEYLKNALMLSSKINALSIVKDIQQDLSLLYSRTHQPEKALEHYKKYVEAKDSIFNEENTKKIVKSEMNFEFEKKQAIEDAKHKSELEKQAAIAEAESKRQNVIIFSIVTGLLLVIVFAGFIFRSLKITRQQNQTIESKNKIIEEKNKDITDSITYAKRIQTAMLPHRRDIWAAFNKSFILYKPRDIVSGDFYFFSPATAISLKEEVVKNSFFIAAADCTGHGVPGAFMSLVGTEKLKEAVAQSNNPSEVLNLLNKGIKISLRQGENDQSTKDGMDIALVRIDLHPDGDATVYYAAANRPIWLIRKGLKDITEIKATKKAIGGITEDNQHFDLHTLKLQQGDTFYLFSDGYADSFGENGKKLMTKKFREILLDIQGKPMKEQGQFLGDFADKWRGVREQIDDILVIGVQV